MNSRDFYRARAKSAIKELREQKGISYEELARRLSQSNPRMEVQVLINRINRGAFSFAFAMEVLAAMGEEQMAIPKLPETVVRKKKPD